MEVQEDQYGGVRPLASVIPEDRDGDSLLSKRQKGPDSLWSLKI